MNPYVMFLVTDTGLHAGGDESIGAIDEPVQRNGITRYPVIHGQSLKGAERRQYAAVRKDTDPTVEALYGSPPPASAEEGADLKQGALDVCEAGLVAFPVPTTRETFAWVTSPLALNTLMRSARRTGLANVPAGFGLQSEGDVFVADGHWVDGRALDFGDFFISHDSVHHSSLATDWAEWIASHLPADESFDYLRSKLARDLFVVADHVLTSLTTEFTEVNARVQLDNDKTVAEGPFYTEYVPALAVFAAYHGSGRSGGQLDAVRSAFDEQAWTIGGDESIGKGIVWTTIATAEGAEQ